MATREKHRLEGGRTDGDLTRYGPLWIVVGNRSKYQPTNGAVVVGSDMVGPSGDWWTFRQRDAHLAVSGARLYVELTTKPQIEGDGVYQDVDKVVSADDRPAAPTAAGPAARVADDPGRPGPDTSIPENTPQPADHRLRTGAEWDEPPSFFHWKERGIQKMSALKAAVEFLVVHDHPGAEALAWRLMNELADGKPYAAMEAPQTAQEPGEEAGDA